MKFTRAPLVLHGVYLIFSSPFRHCLCIVSFCISLVLRLVQLLFFFFMSICFSFPTCPLPLLWYSTFLYLTPLLTISRLCFIGLHSSVANCSLVCTIFLPPLLSSCLFSCSFIISWTCALIISLDIYAGALFCIFSQPSSFIFSLPFLDVSNIVFRSCKSQVDKIPALI